MKVLHVVTAWPRDSGDVVTPWLVALCEKQVERGHRIDVLAPSYRGLSDRTVNGVRIRRFRYAPRRWERLTHEETTPDRLARHPGYALLVPGYLVAGALAAVWVARRQRYDVVHVHWAVPHGMAGWLAAKASRGETALVTTFYGAEVRWSERRFPPGRPFLRWYSRRSRLVAISRSTRDALAPYAGGRPIAVVPYGVPLPDSEPGSRPDGPPVVLFVGRLVARKGVDRLLEAMARITDRPWRLEIVGFGPERERLEALAAERGLADRVAFRGRLSDADLAIAYRRAACFVLPATLDARADTEGLGVVLLEAMSVGTPVVATRRGGIVDVVTHGETGILVEDDVAALARGVADLLDDPVAAEAMGRRARDHVRDAFGWDTILDRLDAVYRGAESGP